MPTTSWAERAYSSGALARLWFAFPSLLQLRMRIEVPEWRDLATARSSTADLPAEEDSASEDTGWAERSPRLALPVPVGMVETQADEADEATEDEAMNATQLCLCQGVWKVWHRRNSAWQFPARDIGAESAWLTSRLRIAMSRTGWNLISARFSLTKVPVSVLSDDYRKGCPFTPKMADRLTTNMARFTSPKRNGISSVGGSLGTPRSDSNSRAISRHLETTWATARKPPIQVQSPPY